VIRVPEAIGANVLAPQTRSIVQRVSLLCTIMLLGCIGCRNPRNDECRAFVYAVNTRLAEIDRVTAQGTQTHDINPNDMRKLAELYDKLADKTGAIAIGSTELGKLRDQYRTMVLDAAKLARGIADSLESKNLEAAMKAHEQFSAVVSREDELVSRVNAYCRQTP
jgi:hypothetical protein